MVRTILESHVLLYALFLLPHITAIGQQSHMFSMKLHHIGANSNITFNQGGVPNFSGTSDIYESDINMLQNKMVRLHRYQLQDNFEIVFNIENVASSLIDMGFSNFEPSGNGVNNYIFKFVTSGGGNKVKVKSPTYESNNYNYTSNTVFSVKKCGVQIQYFIDGNEVHSETIAIQYQRYESIALPLFADNVDLYLTSNIVQSCSTDSGNSIFAELNTKLPNSITKIVNGKLNFYFLQKYNVDLNINDEVQINLFTDSHQLMNNTPIIKKIKYGSNYISVDLDDEGIEFQKALVEVSGINKGSIYYLKLINSYE